MRTEDSVADASVLGDLTSITTAGWLATDTGSLENPDPSRTTPSTERSASAPARGAASEGEGE